MKNIFIFLIFLLFSTFSLAEQYPNSWKMNIQCKDGKDKWYEAHYVVDVVDDAFTLDLGPRVRWNWSNFKVFFDIFKKNI